MVKRTVSVVFLVLLAGCEKPSFDPSPVATHGEQLSPTNQLPEVSEWISERPSTLDPFAKFGVRDPNAPNMLLRLWLDHNPPDPNYSLLHRRTADALRYDTASIIDLHDVPLVDKVRSQLGGLRQVRWLRLSAGVTSADLVWIGRMRQLRGLSLTHADLTDADFQSLASIESLQWLTLARSQMSPEDFSTLPRLDRLQTLWLAGDQVTDTCLEHLAEIRLPSLLSLGLYYTSITDGGMMRLCETYDLEYMDFFFSRQVTENCVPSIACMESLRSLGVGMSGMAPQGRRTEAVDELIRRLPKCRVDYCD